jgi:hypothetical protein
MIKSTRMRRNKQCRKKHTLGTKILFNKRDLKQK